MTLNKEAKPLVAPALQLCPIKKCFHCNTKSSIQGLLVWFLTSLQLCATQIVQPYDMKSVILDGVGENQCRKHLEKLETGWSGFIYSHEPYPGPYSADKNCFLMLEAPENYRIRLTVLDFAVNGRLQDCKKDSLHVFDQEESETDVVDGPGPILGTFCGRLKNGTILATSTMNSLTLWWHTDSKLHANHLATGFRLFWTVFRKTRPEGCSQDREFQCANLECIPLSMACDRIAHCSDKSDLDTKRQRLVGCDVSDLEQKDGLLGSISDVALAGICIGSVLGSVLLCVGVIICCRDTCRKQRSREFASHNSARQANEYMAAPANGYAPTSGANSSEHPPPDFRTSSSSPTYYVKPTHANGLPRPHRAEKAARHKKEPQTFQV